MHNNKVDLRITCYERISLREKAKDPTKAFINVLPL